MKTAIIWISKRYEEAEKEADDCQDGLIINIH